MPGPANDYEAEVLRKISDLKHPSGRGLLLDCLHDKQPYSLVLLTSEHAEDQKIIELLAKWRKKHQWWFPAQFNVTAEGTATWLRNGVIETPDRLLFMIRLNTGYVGHVGLFRFNFGQRVCEIDNIVRGEDGQKGIIGIAIVHMMQWGMESLGLRGYHLQTFSDNVKSLALYNRLGFSEIKRIPLVRVEKTDRIEWSDAPAAFSGEALRYNVLMELTNPDEAWGMIGK